MYNSWGGSLEVDSVHEDDQSRSMDLDRAALQKLEETQQSWLLGAGEKKKKQYIDLGCVTCSRKLFMGFVYAFAFIALIIGLTVLIVKTAPRHKHRPAPPDNYTLALHKALRFFNAQKSGVLPKSNNISYRGNSALKDGNDITKDLVGGYYDAGDNIKFTFPQAYAMTLLSWSVIEYSNKYEAVGELSHVKELIKWGLDYLLKTFNSTAPFNDTLSIVDQVVIQVGQGVTPGDLTGTPNDHYCWQRPEDMSYARPTHPTGVGSDVGAELAAALAAGSIVFKDNNAYSRRLVNAAQNVFKWARDKRGRYSAGDLESETFYNSSGYYDEYLWGGTWLYYATGNSKYLQLVTTYGIGRHAGAYWGGPYYGVFSWDSKLIGAQVLLTRLRIMQNPGYPYEDVLKNFNNHTNIVMCSYLPYYKRFTYTPGGLAVLDQGNFSHLQYTVSAAFLATLYADYMVAADVAGWYCGPTFYPAKRIKQWAQSQIDYILGKNPLKMSYVVGFGKNYPKQVHHRAASIPKGQRPSCTGGWAWRNKNAPNPNVLEGAMVAGPDRRDRFHDARQFWNFTEPTIAGNAALIGTLIGLSGIDSGKDTGVDTTTIFSAIPPQFPASPPPSPPWSP